MPRSSWPSDAAVGLAVTYGIRKRLVALQMLDGRPRHSWPYGLALVVVLPGLLSLLLGASWSITLPELRGFNFVGGLTLAPEYFALLIALAFAAVWVADAVAP